MRQTRRSHHAVVTKIFGFGSSIPRLMSTSARIFWKDIPMMLSVSSGLITALWWVVAMMIRSEFGLRMMMILKSFRSSKPINLLSGHYSTKMVSWSHVVATYQLLCSSEMKTASSSKRFKPFNIFMKNRYMEYLLFIHIS